MSILPILYFIAPTLALLSPKSMVGFLTVITVFNLYTQWKKGHCLQLIPTPMWIVILGFLILTYLSYFWSIDPGSSIKGCAQLSLLTLLACVFWKTFEVDTASKKALLFGFCLALFLILIDANLGHFWQNLRHRTSAVYIQGGLFMSLCTWVAIHVLLEKRKILLSILLYGASILILHLIECDTIILAMVLAPILSFLLVSIKNIHALKGFGVVIVLLFTSAPWMFKTLTTTFDVETTNKYITSESYLHRLVIWRNTAEKILEKPLLGYGFRTYRSHGAAHSLETLVLINKQGKKQTVSAEPFGLHPHNIALQLYFELGFLGALLGGILCASLFIKCMEKPHNKQRFTSLAFYTTAMIILWINLGAFQNWWLSSIILLSAFLRENSPYSHETES